MNLNDGIQLQDTIMLLVITNNSRRGGGELMTFLTLDIKKIQIPFFYFTLASNRD